MITSFGDQATADLYHGRATQRVRRFPPEMVGTALRKLDMLHASRELRDLRSPPGNHLESLKGVLKEFYSIRVNEQWRVVFKWEGSNAFNVKVTDYH
ncbi:MAG: type II toxin-antitoxin system RelE/ParE family toxin [bacterium]